MLVRLFFLIKPRDSMLRVCRYTVYGMKPEAKKMFLPEVEVAVAESTGTGT
jgi:hypothetical protein